MQHQRSTLSEDDKTIIRKWNRTHKYAAAFWGISFLPLLYFSIWISIDTYQHQLNVLPVIIMFYIMAAITLMLFIKMLRKYFLTIKCVDKNEKNVYKGIVQNLQTRKYTKLLYTIDDNTIEVFSHLLQANLINAGCIKDITAKLYAVEVAPGKQLLLEVKYDQIPSVQKTIQSISATEKANNNNKKDSIDALKITAVILGVVCFICSMFFRGGGLVMILGVYLFCFLLIGSVIYYMYRVVEGYTEKYVVEGSVTELIRIRYKVGKSGGYKQMNWYRVGYELFPGSTTDTDGLRPGDTARFEYYAGKKKQRRELIRIIRL